MLRTLFDLFIEWTAWMTDGQYYAMVILLSFAFAMAVGCIFDLVSDSHMRAGKHWRFKKGGASRQFMVYSGNYDGFHEDHHHELNDAV